MVVVCAVFLTAPAVGGVTVSARSNDAVLSAGGEELRATLGGSRLRGQHLAVQRRAQRLRGEVIGKAVDLRWSEERVTGVIGGRRVRLEVSQVDQAFELEGIFVGFRADLRVSPTEITGRLGSCDYALTAAGESYQGFRDCEGAGLPVPTTLRLPASLARASDAEQAAVIVLMLADYRGLPNDPVTFPGDIIRSSGM